MSPFHWICFIRCRQKWNQLCPSSKWCEAMQLQSYDSMIAIKLWTMLLWKLWNYMIMLSSKEWQICSKFLELFLRLILWKSPFCWSSQCFQLDISWANIAGSDIFRNFMCWGGSLIVKHWGWSALHTCRIGVGVCRRLRCQSWQEVAGWILIVSWQLWTEMLWSCKTKNETRNLQLCESHEGMKSCSCDSMTVMRLWV